MCVSVYYNKHFYLCVCQWAKIVLMIEQSVTPQRRLQQQLKYSQPVTGKKAPTGRAFVVRWHQTVRLAFTFGVHFLFQSVFTLLPS